eukprot:m.39553 g.39553  ORF g.39553 m.39553 type:complete len:73 (-) comp5828_c0_seq1:125-343(-)
MPFPISTHTRTHAPIHTRAYCEYLIHILLLRHKFPNFRESKCTVPQSGKSVLVCPTNGNLLETEYSEARRRC